jgi:2-keto-4-pentenoate hydratase/2-oxohepta-3-ene-1,7-dioic acid hydratase in catechol pathway
MSIYCIGRNYVAHAKELGNEVPTSPVIFMKPSTALLNKGEQLTIPSFTKDLHYEAELVLRVNKVAKKVQNAHVMDYCDAISIGIDFTARDIQNDLKSKRTSLGKSKSI